MDISFKEKVELFTHMIRTLTKLMEGENLWLYFTNEILIEI